MARVETEGERAVRIARKIDDVSAEIRDYEQTLRDIAVGKVNVSLNTVGEMYGEIRKLKRYREFYFRQLRGEEV